MRLFRLKRNKEQLDCSAKETINRIVDYMPDFYKTQRQFINCLDFIEHNEWGLALDSLIELTQETEHYFSEDFWSGLADSADKMNMKQQASFCRKQIDRNAKDVKFKTSFGWTTVKIDDNHFQQHISEKLKDEWANERHKKDNVLSLIDKNGIHNKSHGRTGFLYYVTNRKIAELEYELGTQGLILWFNASCKWIYPAKQDLDNIEKGDIEKAIQDWATNTKNAIDIE
jgi:hypothetical protein